MRIFITFVLLHLVITSFSQEKDFYNIVLNQTTSVKDQEETGSCWAYAACSFFESELLRTNKGEYDLSEAFLVYYAYLDKAQNYFLRQSKTNFATGALSHDAIKIINEKGIIPNEFYKGEYLKDNVNDYFEMHDVLAAYLNSVPSGILTRLCSWIPVMPRVGPDSACTTSTMGLMTRKRR